MQKRIPFLGSFGGQKQLSFDLSRHPPADGGRRSQQSRHIFDFRKPPVVREEDSYSSSGDEADSDFDNRPREISQRHRKTESWRKMINGYSRPASQMENKNHRDDQHAHQFVNQPIGAQPSMVLSKRSSAGKEMAGKRSKASAAKRKWGLSNLTGSFLFGDDDPGTMSEVETSSTRKHSLHSSNSTTASALMVRSAQQEKSKLFGFSMMQNSHNNASFHHQQHTSGPSSLQAITAGYAQHAVKVPNVAPKMLETIFLVHQQETKRAVIPTTVGLSISSIKMLFVRAFGERDVTIDRIHSPNMRLFIHDDSEDRFHRLECNLHNVTDRCVILLFECLAESDRPPGFGPEGMPPVVRDDNVSTIVALPRQPKDHLKSKSGTVPPPTVRKCLQTPSSSSNGDLDSNTINSHSQDVCSKTRSGQRELKTNGRGKAATTPSNQMAKKQVSFDKFVRFNDDGGERQGVGRTNLVTSASGEDNVRLANGNCMSVEKRLPIQQTPPAAEPEQKRHHRRKVVPNANLNNCCCEEQPQQHVSSSSSSRRRAQSKERCIQPRIQQSTSKVVHILARDEKSQRVRHKTDARKRVVDYKLVEQKMGVLRAQFGDLKAELAELRLMAVEQTGMVQELMSQAVLASASADSTVAKVDEPKREKCDESSESCSGMQTNSIRQQPEANDRGNDESKIEFDEDDRTKARLNLVDSDSTLDLSKVLSEDGQMKLDMRHQVLQERQQRLELQYRRLQQMRMESSNASDNINNRVTQQEQDDISIRALSNRKESNQRPRVRSVQSECGEPGGLRQAGDDNENKSDESKVKIIASGDDTDISASTESLSSDRVADDNNNCGNYVAC